MKKKTKDQQLVGMKLTKNEYQAVQIRNVLEGAEKWKGTRLRFISLEDALFIEELRSRTMESLLNQAGDILRAGKNL